MQIPLYVLHFIPYRVILNLQILYVPGAQYRPLAWHTWRIRYFFAMAFISISMRIRLVHRLDSWKGTYYEHRHEL